MVRKEFVGKNKQKVSVILSCLWYERRAKPIFCHINGIPKTNLKKRRKEKS